jgi:hypothetical protein
METSAKTGMNAQEIFVRLLSYYIRILPNLKKLKPKNKEKN